MRTKLAGLFAVLIVTALLSACGGGGGGTDTGKGSITGQIMDVATTLGIVDSTVTLNGEVIATGNEANSAANSGWYTAEGIEEGNKVLCFQADDYVKKCRTVTITSDKMTPITPTFLQKRGPAKTIADISAGGPAILSTAASITFPADSVCDSDGEKVTGEVKCYLTPADVTNLPGFEFAPNSFSAVGTDGDRGTMVSSAMMEITCEKDGEEVNLCDGKTADVRLPIYSADCAGEPDELPGWRFDETTGLWQEYDTGEFTKTCDTDETNSYYAGSIDHMTWINGDRWVADACLTGTVYTDSTNATTEPVTVTCWGAGWRNEVQVDPASGTFCIPVPKGMAYTCNVGDNARWMDTSGSETITGTAPNTTMEFPLDACPAEGCTEIKNIVFASPIFTTTLTWGAEPLDLDAHTLNDDNMHVFYQNRGSLTASPFVYLNTDDINSYGPEITTVMPSATSGLYCFGVYNFSTTPNMSNESVDRNDNPVRATVQVQGGDISQTFEIPSSNPEDYLIWKVYTVEFSGGKVVEGSFREINQMADYNDPDIFDCSKW